MWEDDEDLDETFDPDPDDEEDTGIFNDDSDPQWVQRHYHVKKMRDFLKGKYPVRSYDEYDDGPDPGRFV